MKRFEKLGRIYLLNACIDVTTQWRDFEGWHLKGKASYKIGRFGKVKRVTFKTVENRYKIAFTDTCGTEIPQDKEDRRNLLLIIYSLIGKMQFLNDLKIEFNKQDAEEMEEQRRKQEEEHKKRIALGEQVSIEKYLLNK